MSLKTLPSNRQTLSWIVCLWNRECLPPSSHRSDSVSSSSLLSWRWPDWSGRHRSGCPRGSSCRTQSSPASGWLAPPLLPSPQWRRPGRPRAVRAEARGGEDFCWSENRGLYCRELIQFIKYYDILKIIYIILSYFYHVLLIILSEIWNLMK